MSTVTLVDTSVLCELLQVPGKSDPTKTESVTAEMDRRAIAGERFVIPVTSSRRATTSPSVTATVTESPADWSACCVWPSRGKRPG